MKFTNLVLIIKKYRYLLTIIFVIGIFICFSFGLGKNYGSPQRDLSVSNENEEVIEEKTTSDSLDQTHEEAGGKVIEFKLPDGNVLSVDENRITEFYGWGHLENRWELEEVDTILNSMKGFWEIDEYIGFLSPNIYNGMLFDFPSENDPYFGELYDQYDEKVRFAKENVPDIFFSIKETNYENTSENYIYTGGRFYSPVNIILSMDRSGDYYPVLSERTTISGDFTVEYPVLYIQFFLNDVDENQRGSKYQSATIIITSDPNSKILLLTEGAFYSIKKMEDY